MSGMTDVADRLDALADECCQTTDDDYLARLANGHLIASDCADFIREHGAEIAARLRGDAATEQQAVGSMLRGRVLRAAFGIATIEVDCADLGPNTIGAGHEILIYNATKNGPQPAPSTPVVVTDELIAKMLPGALLFAEEAEHLADARRRAKQHLEAALSAPCYPPHDSAECKRCHPDAPSEQEDTKVSAANVFPPFNIREN